jgi:RNA polymerase sigma factor (TIGR02999 family)
MTGPEGSDSTRLLKLATEGDQEAAARLLPVVYDELRRLAARRFGGQPPGHTLQATALVHEAYLRLVHQEKVDWRGRTHFFATAARAMHQILIDHARSRNAAKRGGSRNRITLSGLPVDARETDFSDLIEALEKLAALNPRHHDIVRLRFFGGLNVKEVAEALGISTRSVEEGWRMARAWLLVQLQRGE